MTVPPSPHRPLACQSCLAPAERAAVRHAIWAALIGIAVLGLGLGASALL